MLTAASDHRSADRRSILEQCEWIGGELRLARSEIAAALSTAPAKVTAHSRVKDVLEALNDAEAKLGGLRQNLT